MTKKPVNHHQPWSHQETVNLQILALHNTPTRLIGLKLGRTEDAVRAKASEHHISLAPWNQSPYNRRPGK